MNVPQYTKDSCDVEFETISNVVKRFAINGYYDVPGRNLERIAVRCVNIHEALQMAPSPGCLQMLQYLERNGYDWRWETKSERPPAVQPAVDQ